MAAGFATVTATVLRPGAPTRDRLGNPVPGLPTEEVVADVLVDEPTTDDLEAARPYGASVAYVLHFPKAYAASLEGCTVLLPAPYGREGGWRVVGDPRPYMAGNVPGRWDRRVRVEAAHG